MSRPRRYPVGGDAGPPRVEKPVPTKEQLMLVMDVARTATTTKPELLLSVARLFSAQPPGTRNAEAIAWARQVMDYPAAERLVDQMERDGLIVAKQAWEWAEVGHQIPAAQARTTYLMTARRALEITERHEQHRDEDLFEKAGHAADMALRRLHPEQWARLRDEAYDAIRKGLPDRQGEETTP